MRLRTRMFFWLFLTVAGSLLGRSASASTSMVLHAVGTLQGNIAGESIVSGHNSWIDIFSYSWGMEVPIGANGQPTGPARPTALSLMKAFDRASLKLLGAGQTEEVFSTWTMDFVNNGTLAVYYRIALTGAHIISYQQSGSSETPSESVSLAYSSITLTDVLQSISVTYNWNASGPAVIVTQDFLGKGILLPPSPNPTRGMTQFRFSLPNGMDSDLTLFDAQGRVVRKLHHGSASTASMVSVWDGTDDGGLKVAPGIYMARLAYPGAVVTQHFAVVR